MAKFRVIDTIDLEADSDGWFILPSWPHEIAPKYPTATHWMVENGGPPWRLQILAEEATQSDTPEPPFPVGAGNAKRVGWRCFFEGKARDKSPFPPDRTDLKRGYEEGWDAAKESIRG